MKWAANESDVSPFLRRRHTSDKLLSAVCYLYK